MSKKTYYQKALFDELDHLSGKGHILAIHSAILGFCNNHLPMAAFLSQLIYWCDKGKRADGYIFKSAAEWTKETGVSRYHISQATNMLTDIGVLTTVTKKAKGSPTLHYKFDRNAFHHAIKEFIADRQIIQNPAHNICNSITEITTEISKETTSGEAGGLNGRSSLSYREYADIYELDEISHKSILYYLKKYREFKNFEHPPLTEDQWDNVTDSIMYFEELKRTVDWEAMVKIIDWHFSNTHKLLPDMSISIFNGQACKAHIILESERR